jgi:flavin reductase (DIM6/NTAB) family NADH-FMN oxidoreductase RutF
MADYLEIDPETWPLAELHQFFTSTIAPRPIAFASTIDPQGRANLAPFSYFNIFSSRPPILIFSPSRSGRTGEHKDTFLNIQEVPEVVINIINYALVEQANLTSTSFDRGISEFGKAGLTPLKSDLVRPPRVAESPVQLECAVQQVIELAQEPSAGNLIICRILKLHLDRSILAEDGKVDPYKLDAVGRMGGAHYIRTGGQGNAAVFKVGRPQPKHSIGVDELPAAIRESTILTGNDLGRLGNVEALPDAQAIDFYRAGPGKALLASLTNPTALHQHAQQLLQAGDITTAWLLLLAAT